MRLFWKLFCSMVTITALACSIGGFVLIDGQFRAGPGRPGGADNHGKYPPAAYAAAADAVFPHLHPGGGGTPCRRGPPPRKTGTPCAFASATARETSWPGTVWRQSPPWSRLFRKMRPAGRFCVPVITSTSMRRPRWLWRTERSIWKLAGGGKPLYPAQDPVHGVFLCAAGAAAGHGAGRPGPERLDDPAAGTAFRGGPAGGRAGALERRVEIQGDDEIAQLGRDFNQMASQLERHVTELTDHARRQEEFLHSFAHETKTPLTAIIGYGELLLSRPGGPGAGAGGRRVHPSGRAGGWKASPGSYWTCSCWSKTG